MSQLTNEIFQITSDQIRQAREYYGKSESDVMEIIEILKEWLKKQAHFPHDHDDERLERFLLRNKFRIEQTKVKLENYYTLRGYHLDFFSIIDPLSPEMRDCMKSNIWALMPKLTPNLERVIVWKLRDTENNKLYKFKNTMMYIISSLDIQLSNDYAIADRIIYDMEDFNFTHYKTIDPSFLIKAVTLHQEAFSGRISGVEFLNAPFFMDIFMNLLKRVVKPKLFAKFTIHKDITALQQIISKDYLPAEYGGYNEKSEVYHQKMCQLMEQERQFILKHAKRVSDETKRIGGTSLNEIFGIPGSFRRLSID